MEKPLILGRVAGRGSPYVAGLFTCTLQHNSCTYSFFIKVEYDDTDFVDKVIRIKNKWLSQITKIVAIRI